VDWFWIADRSSGASKKGRLVSWFDANGAINLGTLIEHPILHHQSAAANVTDMFGWITFHQYEISPLARCNRTEFVLLLQKPGGIEGRYLQCFRRRIPALTSSSSSRCNMIPAVASVPARMGTPASYIHLVIRNIAS
jgi:hypothetical protein